MSITGVATVVLLLIAVVLFTAQHYAVVQGQCVAWPVTTGRALLIVATLVLGVVLGWLTAPQRRRPTDRRTRVGSA